jgi:hypothetical protein
MNVPEERGLKRFRRDTSVRKRGEMNVPDERGLKLAARKTNGMTIIPAVSRRIGLRKRQCLRADTPRRSW